MTKFRRTVLRSALVSFAVSGVMSAATVTGDLSRYHNFRFGADLSTVAKQAGGDASQAKVIHSRPALIQELEWRPQPFAPSSQTESAKDVVLSFYNGELYQVLVNYDRHDTEGLTADDVVDAISAVYGMAAKVPASAKAAQGIYSQQEVLARWEDPQYYFDLIRLSYGPSFRLIGVLKRLEAPAQAAILEAMRLDDQEAPQRDAARRLSQEEAARVELEKARLLNRPKFRP